MLTNYLTKYKNYKFYYNRLKEYLQNAGDYVFDEEKVLKNPEPSSKLREQIVDIDNYSYVAGPVSICFIEFININKRILLFGDLHSYNDRFICGPDDSLKTLYGTVLCNTLFKKNPDKIFDVFTESYFYRDPSKKSINNVTNSGFMSNFFYTYDICYAEREGNIECSEQIKNVRFHHMNIRNYSKYDYNNDDDDLKILSDNFIKFGLINDAITNFNDINGEIKKISNTITDYFKEIYDKTDIDNHVLFNDIKLAMGKDYISKDDYNHTWISFPEYNYDLDNRYNKVLNAFKKYDKGEIKYLINQLEDLIVKLRNFKTAELFKSGNPIYLGDSFLEFIRKYIANERIGIYSNDIILKNAFELCNSIPRIKRNIGNNKELIEKNYKTNYNFDINYQSNNMIKMIIKDRKINNVKVNNVSIITILFYILAMFGAIIMDIYLLSRTLKKFDINKKGLKQEYANDIIIIAGNDHIKNYINFYKKIGGDESILFIDENKKRCVKNPSSILKKYYNI